MKKNKRGIYISRKEIEALMDAFRHISPPSRNWVHCHNIDAWLSLYRKLGIEVSEKKSLFEK